MSKEIGMLKWIGLFSVAVALTVVLISIPPVAYFNAVVWGVATALFGVAGFVAYPIVLFLAILTIELVLIRQKQS